MLIKTPLRSACSEAEVTPESVYLSRRRFMTRSLALGALAALPGVASATDERYAGVDAAESPVWFSDKLPGVRWQNEAAETVTPFRTAAHYNNFYEFGPGKADPSRNAGDMPTQPWTITIDGEVGKPGTYALEDLIRPQRLEERIYRLRCVEAWSMVIPWLGFSLRDLLARVEPSADARFVRFESLADKESMPGVRSVFGLLRWPYSEGLRLDEAMHPLSFLAVGMYGRILPNQNGAPVRLVVPWKYGFKSIKSIVRITLMKGQPVSSWQQIAPREYGFYANVNPDVSHPRWSQAEERRLPTTLLSSNVIKTRLFNGYDEVADLYTGMDLKVNY